MLAKIYIISSSGNEAFIDKKEVDSLEELVVFLKKSGCDPITLADCSEMDLRTAQKHYKAKTVTIEYEGCDGRVSGNVEYEPEMGVIRCGTASDWYGNDIEESLQESLEEEAIHDFLTSFKLN